MSNKNVFTLNLDKEDYIKITEAINKKYENENLDFTNERKEN